jgi:hypothetical protein
MRSTSSASIVFTNSTRLHHRQPPPGRGLDGIVRLQRSSGTSMLWDNAESARR